MSGHTLVSGSGKKWKICKNAVVMVLELPGERFR